MMKIDISAVVASIAPMDYSASMAEIGADAGPSTWRAACEDSPDYAFLQSADELQAMRDFARDSGGWTVDELQAMPDDEIRALFLQWISGDLREMFPGRRTLEGLTDAEWQDAESRQESGQCPGNIYRGDSGRVYFYLGG